jgi:hypothetical protein
MKLAIAFLIAFLFWKGSSAAQESKSTWDCFCEGRPCACAPLPPSDPQLCDIQCPRNSQFVPDCSCEPLRNEQEREEERRLKRWNATETQLIKLNNECSTGTACLRENDFHPWELTHTSAVESARKPIQSKRSVVPDVWSLSAIQMQKRVAMPGGTIMKKAARQFHASAGMAPTIGHMTGPHTVPTSANGRTWRGNIASRIACPSGAIGAPNLQNSGRG